MKSINVAINFKNCKRKNENNIVRCAKKKCYGTDIGVPVEHVCFCVFFFCDKPNVFGYWGVSWTRPLTIHNLMKIVRITDFCWFHEDLDPVLTNLIEQDHHLVPIFNLAQPSNNSQTLLHDCTHGQFLSTTVSQDDSVFATTFFVSFILFTDRSNVRQ